MKWQHVVDLLRDRLPAGSISTYAEVSMAAYGRRDRNQPVGSLLRGASNHGYQVLTNRIVKTSGELAELPGERDQQRAQLMTEGVPFTEDGHVDLVHCPPVALTRVDA
jgi:alkylated DNA nucleotide flippase Atl1